MIGNFKIFLTLYGKDIDKWVNIGTKFKFLDGFELYAREDVRDLTKNRSYLKEIGETYEYSLHAPYAGLSIPPMNKNTKQIVTNIYKETIEFAKSLDIKNIILHGNYSYIYFIEETYRALFLSKLSKFLKDISVNDHKGDISFENVFEPNPQYFFNFIKGIQKLYPFKYCIDTGHLNFLSAGPMNYWFKFFNRDIREVHLHDNDAIFDQHLYPGGGNIDFNIFFKYLIDNNLFPQITLELHNIDHIEIGLNNLRDLLLKIYEKK